MALDRRRGAAPRWSSILLGYTPPTAPLGSTQRTGKPPLHWLHVEIIILTLELLNGRCF